MSTKDPAKQTVHHARENLINAITEALCERYKELTGKAASDRLHDQIWYAINEVA